MGNTHSVFPNIEVRVELGAGEGFTCLSGNINSSVARSGASWEREGTPLQYNATGSRKTHMNSTGAVIESNSWKNLHVPM